MRHYSTLNQDRGSNFRFERCSFRSSDKEGRTVVQVARLSGWNLSGSLPEQVKYISDMAFSEERVFSFDSILHSADG